MKKINLAILLLTGVWFSACKKDAVTPVAPESTSPTQIVNSTNPVASTGAATSDSIKYIRLQLAKDSINADAVLVVFKAGAQTTYNGAADARTLQGFGEVSLSSLSSDHIALGINTQPLPVKSLTIGLVVNAKATGVYKLNLTKVSALPAIYQIWLMDSYKKDSLDFRDNPTFAFSLTLGDTNSYGSHRFSLVIRENVAMQIHLLNFTASKTSIGAQVKWQTENEENYTTFAVERSTDNGQSFVPLTGFTSTSSLAYNYVDKNPAKGTDEYRLKITDLNGTVTYSKAISLDY